MTADKLVNKTLVQLFREFYDKLAGQLISSEIAKGGQQAADI